MATNTLIYVNASIAPSIFSVRDQIPEDIEEILGTFPEIEKVTQFVQQCLLTSNNHTVTFRKMSARIVDACIKCLSIYENEIFGYRKRSVAAQIFWSRLISSFREYSMYMKYYYNQSTYSEGQAGSFSISLSEDAFFCLESIEKWNQIGDLVVSKSEKIGINTKYFLSRIINGTRVYQV